ncbi:hypothetical protein B0H19DRAFT_1077580 [Mycena capillaripes]|nr:hypothetical protein B0H19DRAFT_1077580 [Mycena capillaripes]
MTAALAMLAGGNFLEAGEWRRLADGGVAGVEMLSTSVNGSGSQAVGADTGVHVVTLSVVFMVLFSVALACNETPERAIEAGAAALLMGMIAARGKRRLVMSPPIFDGSDGPLMEGARPAHCCRQIAIIIANYR